MILAAECNDWHKRVSDSPPDYVGHNPVAMPSLESKRETQPLSAGFSLFPDG